MKPFGIATLAALAVGAASAPVSGQTQWENHHLNNLIANIDSAVVDSGTPEACRNVLALAADGFKRARATRGVYWYAHPAAAGVAPYDIILAGAAMVIINSKLQTMTMTVAVPDPDDPTNPAALI